MIPFKPNDYTRGTGNIPCITIDAIPTCLNDFIWFDNCTEFDSWLISNNYRKITIEDIRVLCDKLYRNGDKTVSYKSILGNGTESDTFKTWYDIYVSALIDLNSIKIDISGSILSAYVYYGNTFETANFAEIEYFDIRTGKSTIDVDSFFNDAYETVSNTISDKVELDDVLKDIDDSFDATNANTMVTTEVSSATVAGTVYEASKSFDDNSYVNEPIPSVNFWNNHFDIINNPLVNKEVWICEGEFNPNKIHKYSIRYIPKLDSSYKSYHRITIDEVSNYIKSTYRGGYIIEHDGVEYTLLNSSWCITINPNHIIYYDSYREFTAFHNVRGDDGEWAIPGYQIKGTYFPPIVGTPLITKISTSESIKIDGKTPPHLGSPRFDKTIESAIGTLHEIHGLKEEHPDILSRSTSFMIVDTDEEANFINTTRPFAPNQNIHTIVSSTAVKNSANFNKLSFEISEESE